MKKVKLLFKASKSHRTHNDDYNVLYDGDIGEYPEDVAKLKLRDFPLNFSEVKAGKIEVEESFVEKQPDKSISNKNPRKSRRKAWGS